MVSGVYGTISLFSGGDPNDWIDIGYYPTINAYCISTPPGYSPAYSRWIVGPSPSVPIASTGTGQFIRSEGKRIQAQNCGEFSFKAPWTSMRNVHPLAPPPTGSAPSPCQMAAIDLILGGISFAGAASAFASIAPTTLGVAALTLPAILPMIGATLLFGIGFYLFVRVFQAQADACQVAKPQAPLLKPGFGGNTITMPSFDGIPDWGQLSGAPPDGPPPEVWRRQAGQ